MSLKATLIDDDKSVHLLIGLNKQDMEDLENGRVLTLPPGQNPPLTEESDIILIYEDTDEELVTRMKAHLPPDEAPKNNRTKHRSRSVRKR